MIWPSKLLEIDFKPSHVHVLTGYAPVLQRKWTERHLDFRQSSSVLGVDPLTDRRWFNWVGVQLVAVFGDVLTDLKSASEARAALMVDPIPNVTRTPLGIFWHDYRETKNDLLAVRDFCDETPVFCTAGIGQYSHASRAFIYNISDMQRRLWSKLPEIGVQIEDITAPA